MSRGRKAIELNRDEFQAAIAAIEASQMPKNRSELWASLEASEWAKAQQPRPLTAQVAMNKAKSFGLEIKTPLGKRGEGLGRAVGTKVARKRVPLNLVAMGVPSKFAKKAAKAANGSLKAAIALKCLDCSNWQMKEVRECQVKSCPLFSCRPYQN